MNEKIKFVIKLKKSVQNNKRFFHQTLVEKPEMPTTTEYSNQYLKLKMFIMMNRRVLVKLSD